MASFETDLARYLDAYEREASADEAARAEYGEDYDLTYAVMGEAARLVPAHDMTDPDEPHMVLDSGRFLIIPGESGNTKFLP